MRKLLLALALAFGLSSPALAQNTQCVTRPISDNSNACASTAFVQNALNSTTINAKFLTVTVPNEGVGGSFRGIQANNTTVKQILTVHNDALIADGTDLISAGGGIAFNRSDRSFFGLFREVPGSSSQMEFFTPSSTYFNTPGGTNATLLQLYDGSNGTPVTSIRPTFSISRNEAITADTEGGQNAALMVGFISNNVSGVGQVAQGNALTVNSIQNGSGENVAAYFVATNNSSTGARFWSSYGVFAYANATGSKSSATGVNSVIANNTANDCPYAGLSPGGASCSEIGVFQQSIGAKLHTAGMLLYSNSGQFDVGYAAWAGSIKTATFQDDSSAVTSYKINGSHTNGIDLSAGTYSGAEILGTGFKFDGSGNLQFTSASAQISWSPSAANVGINFGNGSTITRQSADGHVKFASQNNLFEFVGNIGIGVSSPTNQLSFSGQSAQIAWMERNVTAATAGQSLTIQAGGAVSGGTDLFGGNLILSSGIGTGTAGGINSLNNAIIFKTANLGATTGTSDNTPSEAMRVYLESSTFGTICFAQASCSSTAYAFQGNNANTIFNVPNSGTMHFRFNATDVFTVSNANGLVMSPTTGYVQTGATVVGSLPSCAAGTKGARLFVTDANATFTAGIGAVVAAGGANNVPVTCDGTSWRIGANDNFDLQQRKYA